MPESRSRNGWILWVPLALFSLFCGVAIFRLVNPGSRDIPSGMVGKPVPNFDLSGVVPGRPGFSSASLATGTPRLLNIFASWCLPCRAEAPVLDQLKARGVAIDGIAIRDRPVDVAQFLAQYGDPYLRIGNDPQSAVQLALGSSGVPESFVIDGKGVIRYQHIGPIMPQDAETILAEVEKAR